MHIILCELFVFIVLRLKNVVRVQDGNFILSSRAPFIVELVSATEEEENEKTKMLNNSARTLTEKIITKVNGQASRSYVKLIKLRPIKQYSTQQPPQQNIFDRNAKKLQKERAANRSDVDLYDYIKEEIAFRLSDRIFDIKREFHHAVDLGCGRGLLTRHILAENVKCLTLCDISPKMLSQAEGTPGLKIIRQEMDEENFQFPENSLDLVISSLSLHWVNDLPGCFERIMQSLKPDGVFIASMFGGDTLYELRSSLQLAELERKGGISPHISPFTQIRDIGSLLNRAGFTMLTIDTDELVVGYPTIFELMWDLKGMAENNAAFNRSPHLNRDVMFAASAIYQELYGKDKGIPATFQIIYFVGWKPGPNQPTPLPRGSGEVSLKDLGKMIENTNKKKSK